MKKLRITNVGTTRPALKSEITRSVESRYNHRLHAGLLVSHGLDCYRVGKWLGVNARTVQRWVNQFEARGLAALRGQKHCGRPRKLNAEQWGAIRRHVMANPRRLGYPHSLWDAKLQTLPMCAEKMDSTLPSSAPGRSNQRSTIC